MAAFIFIPGVTEVDLSNAPLMTAALDNATYWPAGVTTFCGIETGGMLMQLVASTMLTPVPLGLFASGALGAIYDPGNLATLFQDVAGTVPVTTYGQTVARMLDRSGNGYHATQANAAKRPVYAREPKVGTRNLLLNSRGDGAVLGVIGSGGALPTGWSMSGGTGLTVEIVSVALKGGLPNIKLRILGTGTGNIQIGPHNTAAALPLVSGQTSAISVGVQQVGGSLSNIGYFGLMQLILTASDVFIVSRGGTDIKATATSDLRRLHSPVAPVDPTVAKGLTRLQMDYTGAVDITLDITAWQHEVVAVPTAVQVTGSSGMDITEAGVADVYYLYNDQVDDSLPATVPSLGSNATIWSATGSASTILSAQTVGAGAFETLRGAKTYAVGVIGRSLSGPETTALTAHLQQKRITP